MNFSALGAGIAMLACFGAALGIGLAAYGGTQGIARQPEKEGGIRALAFLGMVLAEACAIYALVIAILLIGKI